MTNEERSALYQEVKDLEATYRQYLDMPVGPYTRDGSFFCHGNYVSSFHEDWTEQDEYKPSTEIDIHGEEDCKASEYNDQIFWAEARAIHNTSVAERYAKQIAFMVLDSIDVIWAHERDEEKTDRLLRKMKLLLTIALQTEQISVQ